MSTEFSCAVNCIDGRAQTPVIEWMKLNAGVPYVDMITEPGADGVLSGRISGGLNQIRKNLEIAVKAHSPQTIAIAGHFQCVANTVSTEEHLEMIGTATKTLQGWFPSMRVVGLFVNEYGAVDVVFDSNLGEPDIKSYL